MITSITKLKNFDIFYNFLWDRSIPEFKKFNLIFGWNRSGKTTLSRIFSACEKKSIIFKEYPENGEFEIKQDNNSNVKSSSIENCNIHVKVFNKDFIEENISFDSHHPCNPIVYISEEDIESKNRLEYLKRNNEKLVETFENAQKDRKKSETMEEKFRIAIAQNIKTTVGSLKFKDKYSSYDKRNIKIILNDVGIDKFEILSEEDFEKYKDIVSNEVKQMQNTFSEYELNFFFNDQNISSFNNVNVIVEQLLSKKVISKALERLKDDDELNSWVKQGFDLHKKKKEKKACLFCQKTLDDGFLDSLSNHFSKDYENLLYNIETFISKLKNLKKERFTEKNNNLYSDLQSGYEKQAKYINNLIDELNKWIDEVIKKLEEKFRNPLKSIKAPEKKKDFKVDYNDIVNDLQAIMMEHNTRVDNHNEVIRLAKEKLEYHLIAVAIEKQDYKTIKQDLEDSIENERNAKNELKTNNEEINMLEQKTSNIVKAIQRINEHLVDFFGRKEIQLELDESRKGYIIKRNGQIANNLSESEKTAIAFSYFIVKVQERDFKIKKGIIFIDDPISSFDLNFVYHCFSLIKNHFKDTGQLFISTHNFALFNLVKEWFLRKENSYKIVEFHMIENIIRDNKREAYLKQLDSTLRKFKSEYHFLFSRLNDFVNDNSPEYADFYTIGNIARRFLEIFTDFKIPTTGDLASKIRQLNIGEISEIKKDKVYKLVQEFSHGKDPVSMIEHIDKTECKEAIKILLNIVEKSDSKHFELLKNCL